MVSDSLINIDDTVLLYDFDTWEWIAIGHMIAIMLYSLLADFLGIAVAYNKFASDKSLNTCNMGCLSKQISARSGYILVYTIPLLAFLLQLIVIAVVDFDYYKNISFYDVVTICLLVFHFARRVFESMYVHILTKKMSLLVVSFISYFYVVCTNLIHATTLHVDGSDASKRGNLVLVVVGIGLFAAGTTANMYVHKVLADSRKDENGNIKTGEYVHPSELGCWFKISYCPHYLVELVAWFGVFFVTRTLYSFLVWVQMVIYLGSKMIKTNRFYTNLDKEKAKSKPQPNDTVERQTETDAESVAVIVLEK